MSKLIKYDYSDIDKELSMKVMQFRLVNELPSICLFGEENEEKNTRLKNLFEFKLNLQSILDKYSRLKRKMIFMFGLEEEQLLELISIEFISLVVENICPDIDLCDDPRCILYDKD